MGLVSKVKYHSLLKDYFIVVGSYLSDGFYIIQDNNIVKTKKNVRNFYKIFKVNSKKKIETPYDKGKLFITKYKYGLLEEDKAYYFIHKKERYDFFKSNYKKYRAELVYPAFELDFFDDGNVVTAPIIKGNVYKDLSHFDSFLVSLFQLAGEAKTFDKTSTIDGNEYTLPWYVQHGDCKNGNIIWDNDNSFTMIDLEAINLYPPLYDVFYYLFISKKEDSVAILKSEEFLEKVKAFYSKLLNNVPDNILDITLANYAYYTSSKLEKNSELYEFEFYLYWRSYDSFNDFPITKKVLKEYGDKLKEYRIK